MDLSKYKDIFGAPNTGLHKYRLFNIAIIDVIMTIIAIIILSKFYNPVYLTIGLFGLGIISHRLFGVRTTIDKLLFSN